MDTSAGFPSFDHLIEPHIRTSILDAIGCEFAIKDLTTGQFMNEFTKCGDTLRFMRDPEAVVHKYIPNQKLKHDFPETTWAEIRAGEGLYFNLKKDDVFMKKVCRSQELTSRWVQSALRQFKYGMHQATYACMLGGVDPCNKGCNAGAQSGCWDLGKVGACKVVNCDNFLEWLDEVWMVLAESCTIEIGMGSKLCGPLSAGAEPFQVLPLKGYKVMRQALQKAHCCGSDNYGPSVTGRYPQRVGGFHIYVDQSGCLPAYKEGNKIVHMLPAGRRDATGLATTMQKMEEIRHPDFFGAYCRGLILWACGVLYPEALAMSRVCFDI